MKSKHEKFKKTRRNLVVLLKEYHVKNMKVYESQ